MDARHAYGQSSLEHATSNRVDAYAEFASERSLIADTKFFVLMFAPCALILLLDFGLSQWVKEPTRFSSNLQSSSTIDLCATTRPDLVRNLLILSQTTVA